MNAHKRSTAIVKKLFPMYCRHFNGAFCEICSVALLTDEIEEAERMAVNKMMLGKQRSSMKFPSRRTYKAGYGTRLTMTEYDRLKRIEKLSKELAEGIGLYGQNWLVDKANEILAEIHKREK